MELENHGQNWDPDDSIFVGSQRRSHPLARFPAPFIKSAIHEQITNEEKASLRLTELEALNRSRLVAAKQNLELY